MFGIPAFVLLAAATVIVPAPPRTILLDVTHAAAAAGGVAYTASLGPRPADLSGPAGIRPAP